MLYNMLNYYVTCFVRRPAPYGPAATGITVAWLPWPGHNWDSVQAPIQLVACRAAGVVICSRLVVLKMRQRAKVAELQARLKGAEEAVQPAPSRKVM